MSNKKIDKLFQEKFKDFEQLPDEKVWNAIETSLDKKKKSHKVIPIWWRLGGVAAALTLLFYVVNPFGENEGTPIVTETNDIQKEKTLLNSDEGTEVFTNESEAITNVDVNSEEKDDSRFNSVAETEEANTNINNAVVNSDNNQGETRFEGISNAKGSSTSTEKGIVSNDMESNTVAENAHAVAESNVDVFEVENNELQNNAVADEEGLTEEVVVVNEISEEAEKKSIFEEIEDANEEVVVDNDEGSKWSVGPSIAPIYFNGLGNGSPIDSEFSANSKSGNVNLSYGIVVSYDISKKLSIRSGLHRVDYGYDTNDIAFSSTFGNSGNGIDNVNLSRSSRNIVVESKVGGAPSAFFAEALSNEVALSNNVLDGKMSQQLGYLELPVELNYTLIDKKFGVNLIGGFSSLLLMDNFVTLESDGLITEMGEANNINSLNFSTNVGLGLQYKVTPKTELTVEPMFKYHLNTFNRISGDFQPFSVGVYSGLKIKF